MAEGGEVEERVDFDEDNYSEMEDEVEEQLEDDHEAEEEEDDDEDNAEEQDGEESDDDAKIGGSDKDQSASEDVDILDAETANNEEKKSPTKIDNEEHAQLLSLPPHGSEVFIGGLPKDTVEEDLRDLCEPIGDIFEVRLMKDRETGENKGYAFVAYKSKEVAQKAIEKLHNKELKGKTLRCSLSETKNRLFIGNVPKIWTEDEFRKIIEDVGPGVEHIELIREPQNPSRNRGFAFVLYYNNACADYSRQKMTNASFKLDGNSPTVTWADPKISPDHSAAAAQVKALYVKNIPEKTTIEQLKELFQQHGEVTKVVMPPGKGGKRDFGFIHYAERSSALKAVKDSEKYEISGQLLEVVLAKPQSEKRPDSMYPYGGGLQSAHVQHPGFGSLGGAQFGSLSAGMGVAASFPQPMIYGRGPMPSGMHMVPMVLPDGRIGYVLQQPGVQIQPQPRPPRRGDRNSGPSGGHGRGGGGDDNYRGRRYRPY